ncbi:hypothetical protein F4819DRAFT_166092 [Hypoxylon fuscum]|nr:hypothetical protein F4819DRAFT_166092 [Hypoxylon fuscum]
MNVDESLITQPCYSITPTLEAYGSSRESSNQCEQNVAPEDARHDVDESDHHQVLGASPFSCAECNKSFSDERQLQHHRHSVETCSCGKKFSRKDALDRHCASFVKATRNHPCKYCKRHRGNGAFRRQDHLIQHLEGYHKFDSGEIDKICPRKPDRVSLVCPHPLCEYHRGEEFESLGYEARRQQSPFKRYSDYTKHMKNIHKETRYPCFVEGCEKVDAKGYSTEEGLKKHLAKLHPTAPQEKYVWYDCGQCKGRYGDAIDYNVHIREAHPLEASGGVGGC